MAPNFYPEIDLVKEAVIPPESAVIVSSPAKEAAPSKTQSNSLSHRFTELVGDNKLLDGISVRSPVYLTDFFYTWRTKLGATTDYFCNSVDRASMKYYDHERRLTSTIANLHSDPRELLLPGLTYSLVAAMSGSVLTRNRNILARIAAPVILGVSCFSYVLPVTFSNTAGLLHDLEKKAFPNLVQKQDVVYSACRNTVIKTKSAFASTVTGVSTGIHKTATFVKEWTGLNI